MSNTYSPCGGFIIASDGHQYPVETAHPLPLPEGIYPSRSCTTLILFGGASTPWGGQCEEDTHWLARRPLPEVPKVKTQEELDEEAFRIYCTCAEYPVTHINTWKAAIAYARKYPDKPAA